MTYNEICSQPRKRLHKKQGESKFVVEWASNQNTHETLPGLSLAIEKICMHFQGTEKEILKGKGGGVSYVPQGDLNLLLFIVCSYSEMLSESFTNSGARPLRRDSELPPHRVV